MIEFTHFNNQVQFHILIGVMQFIPENIASLVTRHKFALYNGVWYISQINSPIKFGSFFFISVLYDCIWNGVNIAYYKANGMVAPNFIRNNSNYLYFEGHTTCVLAAINSLRDKFAIPIIAKLVTNFSAAITK